MDREVEKLLSYCAAIDFGEVQISSDEKVFGTALSDEILYLCQSLPESTQTDAILFFMKHYNISFRGEINFLKYYYTPAWSILYWLDKAASAEKQFYPEELKNAMIVHAMAMLLHVIDDHLKDRQIPITHLTLLIRSQAWMRMQSAVKRLQKRVEKGEEIVQKYIDEYYAGIRDCNEVKSLDQYCAIFKKQMATWLIAPVLTAKLVSDKPPFCEAVISAYTSFGTAWRLLDDIQDIENDVCQQVPSALLVCLTGENKKPGLCDQKQNTFMHPYFNRIIKESAVDSVLNRICKELESAATKAEEFINPGLAFEFRSLLQPLVNKTAVIKKCVQNEMP